MKRSKFNKFPILKANVKDELAWEGWEAIASQLQNAVQKQSGERVVLAIECYQGVYEQALVSVVKKYFQTARLIESSACFKEESVIRAMVQRDLTDDRVFGKMTNWEIEDYFDDTQTEKLKKQLDQTQGLVVIIGVGASLLAEPDVLVYADMARWEIQQRMRSNTVSNIGVNNAADEVSRQYKWGFFIDWRMCDRLKKKLMHRWDFILDTNRAEQPKMVEGAAYREALNQAVNQPLMLVPFFDPGPWGGQWMKEVCDLDKDRENFAWCFNCVPEENSILLQFGEVVMESPSINLVFYRPQELLGTKVYSRFGAEFPIRFDFLDTVEGGNLSMQVHPTTEYIQDHFGMPYTQDESYYMLDAKPGSIVYLGLKDGVEKEDLRADLEKAQRGEGAFPDEKYINRFEVKKHDHFLIPSGTIHCSGTDSMVLEISATPYIFTFKLWDWGRLGLDGKPRPIHIDHGMNVIQMDRTTEWVKENLVNCIEKVAEGEGWAEERTGLHELEFIETRRHWFTRKVSHHTEGTVHVLSLVEGEEALVESPENAFAPFTVHYAETFIIPAHVGAYTIRPVEENPEKPLATLKAYVR
ncbi:class I mannose-6-phosphate isomerase [Rapidithrix thailandica]|uniref:Class I mannose-6-phosphate isomerase n=1 Tax=Rapidithrix thailandica TaxID=413964 RepID=A0AAW9SE78_9BACT